MKPLHWITVVVFLTLSNIGHSACCYFSAKDKDVLQPAQKAFITWDPVKKQETFTVQPKFEGNAVDFGMVIPTPTQPKLHEMPRTFFKSLAVFTILEPMDNEKFQPVRFRSISAVESAAALPSTGVRIVESGVVGSLDYKIIDTDRAADFYDWLKAHEYQYAGDEATLEHYIKKGWFFTVMKIDPKQMKRRGDGSYSGDVTPTRFTFLSIELVYPLKITQLSVKESTEALIYVQAPHKIDLPGAFSYQYAWQPMWCSAIQSAVPGKVTAQEAAWRDHVQPDVQPYARQYKDYLRARRPPGALEWAKKITADDIAVLNGTRPYNRDAPEEDVRNLKQLIGHVQQGQFITKIRKVFHKDEMIDDLKFVRAEVNGKDDDIEYFSILPTSPP